MKRESLSHRSSPATISVCVLLILGGPARATLWGAQNIDFKPLTEQGRPSPPQNLRLLGPTEAPFTRTFNQLQDLDPSVRLAAAIALDEQGPNLAEFVPQLAVAVTNKDGAVRQHVTAALLKLGEKAYEAAPVLVQALSDADPFVRANSAGALGTLGSSAGFAVPFLIKALSDDKTFVRAYAVGALGNIGKAALPAIPEILMAIQATNALVREYAIRALGKIGADARFTMSELTANLPNASANERSLITDTLANIALRVQDQGIVDALPDLRRAVAGIIATKGSTNGESFLEIDRSIKYLELLRLNASPVNSHRQKFSFKTTVPSEFIGQSSLIVNGTEVGISAADHSDTDLYFLGNHNMLARGLNWIGTKRRSILFWFEENKLKEYDVPYTKSSAIIVAIDDYDRSRDPIHRGPTGYKGLSFMVDHAKALASVLQSLGFVRTNIYELYDESATSSKITDTLNRFWQGGDRSRFDRLFFYFGGHGASYGPAACLITYDFDVARPALTSLLMRDITGRHFENVEAHHFLVAIDSCHAGLALPQFLSDELEDKRLTDFRTHSIIESETAKRARNIIVSGTGDQKALWENGGIFTQALVSGLKGDADLNKDGLIQFEELALFVKNAVRAKARETGVIQEPNQWRADSLGRGNVIFIRNDRLRNN